MTDFASLAASSGVGISRLVPNAILSRLKGPGGYYNFGNLIGLVAGLGTELAMVAGNGSSTADGILAYLAGSPASLALTTATLVFLASGELYHRAWGNNELNTDLNRLADMLSAIGALALTVSLVYLNQPILAVLTGLLIVGGKLGSAVNGDFPCMFELWTSDWPDLFRSMVLAGRLPVIVAAGLVLAHQVGVSAPPSEMIQPAVMVVCHLLWIRADILLFRGKSATT